MKSKYKRGAASFYIVAFSTMILVIIAASFATVIISETTRASNDDLSQSAYDAALAGVEDAKLAYSNYRRCLAKGETAVMPDGDGNLTCGEIIWIMEELDSCDMVGLMTGRISEKEWYEAYTNGGLVNGEVFNGEVMVSDTTSNNSGVESDLNQAYTCVKISMKLWDYRANLTSSSQNRLVRIEFDDPAVVKNLESIRFSWYEVKKNEVLNYGNYINNIGKVVFQPIMETAVATPPVVSLQMIQTGPTFTLSSFEQSEGNKTNRATLFFVPTKEKDSADSSKNKIGNKTIEQALSDGDSVDATYLGIYNKSQNRNELSASQVAKTNDHYIKNLPFLTYCPDEENLGGFYCSVDIDLPDPVGGNRNESTFMFFVSLPYGEPDTNFAIEFHCGDGGCSNGTESSSEVAYIKGVQINVDSTGRANDLYRRVETRLETTDTTFAYPVYAVQLFSNDNNVSSASITKNMTVTCESGVTNCD